MSEHPDPQRYASDDPKESTPKGSDDFERSVEAIRTAAAALSTPEVRESLAAIQDAVKAVAIQDAVKAVAIQDAVKAVAIQDAVKAVAIQDAVKAVASSAELRATIRCIVDEEVQRAIAVAREAAEAVNRGSTG